MAFRVLLGRVLWDKVWKAANHGCEIFSFELAVVPREKLVVPCSRRELAGRTFAVLKGVGSRQVLLLLIVSVA